MENRTRRREAGAWAKFRLLMWKNYLQQWRHPIQTAVELLLPIFCMAFMLLLRSQLPPEVKDRVQFTSLQVKHLNTNAKAILSRMNVTQMSIAYSPQNDVLEGVIADAVSDILISNAADLLKLPGLNITLPPDFDLEAVNQTTILEVLKSVIDLRVQGYPSSADLKTIYSREEIVWTTLAAVEFDDSLRDITELPTKVSYALRFPERPRLNALVGFLAGVSWRTDVLFPTLDEAGPRERFSADGGNDPGYFGEMFIALQHAISTALMSSITGEPLQAFDIKLQRFPHPPYVEDFSAEVFQMLFPTFLMVSFSYAAVTTVRAITTEKELQLKETMKIMGMPTWIHWASWFCKQYTFLLIPISLMMLLLKIKIFTNEQGLQYAVLTNTPWSVLLVFLLLYVACAIFFGFMISGFFSKGTTSSIFTGILWYVSYIPAYIMTLNVKMSTGIQYFTCLSINSAMSFGAQIMLAKEDIGGLQWSDFFSSNTTQASQLQFGIVMIMMIVNCVLYMLIALYVEQVFPGPYGTPKPWYFLFHKKFWSFNNKISSDDVMVHNLTDDSEITKEMDPVSHTVGVTMTNLTKVFGKDVAVDNLSLNIFDDQITVLLGHNGAGKSTTISMLTGNLPVTQGSVWVAGYDMTWNTSEARAHIGFCPQHNVLFNDLTVKEHFEFFARLKGFHGKELYDEIDVLIDKLELQEKRNERAKGLSGGQKRRLCVGIALCGDARVVLLDEPTSGMDPSSRRELWDLLQIEKQGRTMILTTHFMDEADILGDRIAIMSSGRLQCVGSPYFLKRHYGVGYTLIIVKNDGFRIDLCTQILAKHIPEIIFKEDRGTEVVYSLLNEDLHLFESMLSDLENNIDSIHFNNYGLTATTLEDVFMSVSSDVSSPDSTPTESSDFDNFSMDNLITGKDVEGIRLVGQHVWAVWQKLWLVWLRSWPVALLQLLVPVLIMTSTLGILQYLFSTASPAVQRRPLTLAEGYTRTETLLNYEGDNSTSLGALAMRAYEDIFTSSGIPTMTVSVLQEPINEYYLRETEDIAAMRQLRRRWLTGATFSAANATAWFSNFGYHDIAASLAAVHSALLRARHPTAEIHVYNHPLPVNYDSETDDANLINLVLTMQMASGVGTSLGIASAVFVMFYVKERMIRAKLLQKAAGIRPEVLWGSAAVFDWLWFLVISIFLVIPCTAFGLLGLSTFAELGRFYLLLMIYGASMLPFNYIASFWFQKPAMSFVVVFFVNMIVGSMGAQLVGALDSPAIGMSSAALIADIIDYILQFFPLYSVVSAVRSLNTIGTTKFTCLQSCNLFPSEDNLECTMDVMCQRLEACCIGDNPYFKWDEPGISRYLVAMVVTCIALWAVLMLIEYNICQRIFRREINPPALDMSTVDPDVRDEARHADCLSVGQLPQHNLVARALTKYYGKHIAVNQVSFSVSDGECFGLLGVNGAGKTTTFKMLMGDESVSSGDAYVGGYSIRKDLNKVHENIGYCPQFDALFGELTGRETLRLYSLIHGFSSQQMASRMEAVAYAVGLGTKYLNKKVNQYSGGNKRKLSTAVSLLGHTRLVFVDEPTTGVDPAAKRQVWRAIRDAMRARRGVVLTSHSMEECEALCSRLTIMVNGRFQCLGSPQHLKNKYSQGFILTIKIKLEWEHFARHQQFMTAVKEYVESNFTNTRLMEQHQGLLTYYLEDIQTAWSRIFGVMERAKRDLHVEDYSISQTTLEQIFLKFAKNQR